VLRGDLEWEGRLISAFHRLGRTPVPQPSAGLQDGWAGAHNDFHRTLLDACDSPWLLSTAETLFDQAERYRRIRASKTPKSTLLRDVTAEHTQLLDAALAHDPARAHKALVEHYSRTVQAALDNIAGAKAPARASGRKAAAAHA
jgi:DNA-binding GntR family transcriptional regulator